MLKLTGKLLTIKMEKTKNDKPFERLQVMTNGTKNTVRIVNVKDFENRDWSKSIGKDIEVPVYVFPWVGKQGIPSLDFVVEK